MAHIKSFVLDDNPNVTFHAFPKYNMYLGIEWRDNGIAQGYKQLVAVDMVWGTYMPATQGRDNDVVVYDVTCVEENVEFIAEVNKFFALDFTAASFPGR